MKKITKRVLSVLLAVMMVASMIPIMAVSSSAADAPGEGMTFTQDKRFAVSNNISFGNYVTLEAEVWVDHESTKDYGVIIGNYQDEGDTPSNRWSFEIKSEGVVRLYTDDAGNYLFDEYDLREAVAELGFVNVAITVDCVDYTEDGTAYTGKVSLYVNGELKQTIATTDANIKSGWFTTVAPLCVGGDRRTRNNQVNVQYFKGEIKNITVYKDLRTADELKASADAASYSVTKSDSALLLAYDLTKSNYGENLNGNGNTLMRENLEDGMGFEQGVDPYQMPKKMSKAPHTFEATIYVPAISGRVGVIFGNYVSAKENGVINFELYNDGAPRLYYTNAEGNTSNIVFDEVDVRMDDWVHLAIVHEGAQIKCYVNGVLAQTKTGTTDYHSTALSHIMCFGDDWRMERTFQGKIKDFAMYSDAKTADEIKTAYESRVDTSDSNILAYYELTGCEGAEAITDLAGKGATLAKYWIEDSGIDTSKYDYTFVAVGDTQKLVYKDAVSENGVTNYTEYIYKWIAENAEEQNIKYVFGMGDITDKNLDAEWVYVEGLINKYLTENRIPYSLIQGNHDTVAQLDVYFKDNPNFTGADIGYYDETNKSLGNYYMRFEVEGVKYMIMGLEYGANDLILNWAGQVCDENPDYRVIVTTHAYMFRDGTTLDKGDVVPPNKSGVTNSDGTSRNNGDMMFDKFVSQHRNILWVMSGHDPYENIAFRQDRGEEGNLISQFLIDPQSFDTTQGYETGMVAIFHVTADGRDFAVEWYSTFRDKYYRDFNQFEFELINNDGNGICFTKHVATSDDGLTDTYRLYCSNGTYEDIYVKNGKDGVGVAVTDISVTATSADGLTKTYTITFSDDSTQTFIVTNDVDGEKGDEGDKGDTGATGAAGEKGKDATSTTVVVTLVVAAAALAGNVAMIVFIILSKKKKII